MLCRFETLLPDLAKGDGKFVRMHGRRAGNGKQMLQRERKLKSIRDPASREVRPEFDQPRPALRLFSKAQTGCGALTLIKAPAVSRPSRPRALKPPKRPIFPKPVEANTDAVPKNVITLRLNRRMTA